MTPALLILALTIATTSGEEVRVGETVCRLSVDATEIPLSGELRLTFSVEGKAPIDVEVPRPLTSSPDWRVHAFQPKTTALADGRERWEQSFRLEPFQRGDAVPLPVQPLSYRTGNEVTDRVMTWKPLAICVTTEITGTDLTQARPPSGIEELPPIPPGAFPWLPVVAILAFIALLTLAVLIDVRKRRSHLPERSAREQALSELRQIDLADPLGPGEVERLANTVRRFFERHLTLAATKQTTAEFLSSVQQAGSLKGDQARQLEDLLRRCDLVKFAGVQPSTDEGIALRADARQLVESCSADPSDRVASLPSRD